MGISGTSSNLGTAMMFGFTVCNRFDEVYAIHSTNIMAIPAILYYCDQKKSELLHVSY